MAGEDRVEEPDPQVLAAAQSGDIHAFEELVRRYQADVWRFCHHLLHQRGAAEDATQETFLRAFRSLRRYRGEAKFSTWLLSIARNCAVDELRGLARRQRLGDALDERPPPAAPDEFAAVEVLDGLERLPLELRECLVLIDVLGLTYRDAARALGVPEGTLKSRVHRGRLELARELGFSASERSDEA